MPEQIMARKSPPASFWKITNDIPVIRHYTEQQQPNDGFSDSEASSDENEAIMAGNYNSRSEIYENKIHTSNEPENTDCNRMNIHIEDREHITEGLNSCDADLYEAICAGQSTDDINVPIMSPPIVEEPKRSWDITAETYQRCIPVDFEMRLRFARALAFKVEETCTFGNVKTADVMKSVTTPAGRRHTCVCSSHHGHDESLCGWKPSGKTKKSKIKKPKNSNGRVSSGLVHGRTATAAAISDTPRREYFRHYKNVSRYIDQYRLTHTVGNVCRRMEPERRPDRSQASKHSKGGYHSRLRPEVCVTIPDSNEVLANLSGSDDMDSVVSSFESGNLWHSDDGSNEDSSNDNRTLSMKDRGKTLNLAPVRECVVPDVSQMQTDNYDQFQEHFLTINQYLNLMTPPYPANKIRQVDRETERRNKGKTVNSRGSHLVPACAPRPGVKALRLGSAEFIKPGTPDQSGDTARKWSGSESRPLLQRSATYHSGIPLPGSDRIKHGDTGKQTTQQQQQRSPTPGRVSTTPSNDSSGMKCKPCDRVCELTNSAAGRQDRQRFTYTHADSVEPDGANRVVPALRPPYVENYAARKDRMLSVNVNHLGIRGKMFKAEDRLNVVLRFERDKSRHVTTLLS